MWGTDALATAAGEATNPVAWWIGGVIVVAVFGAMVWRTIRRNRMK